MGNDREDLGLQEHPENLTNPDIQIQHHHSVAPSEWAIQKLLGPSLDEVGADLSRVYAAGRNMILNAAIRKTPELEDGSRANLRVSHDVFTSGAFSDSEICAEYFGGILASSRSEDGQDDDAIQFVEVTKSLSSKQLHLHYALYNRINKHFVSNRTQVNIAMGSELRKHRTWFSSVELTQNLGLKIATDIPILYRHGLIARYEMNNEWRGNTVTPYCSVTPSMFGVLLYAVSHNRYEDWLRFNRLDFGDYEGVDLPAIYESGLEDLVTVASIEIRQT